MSAHAMPNLPMTVNFFGTYYRMIQANLIDLGTDPAPVGYS